MCYLMSFLNINFNLNSTVQLPNLEDKNPIQIELSPKKKLQEPLKKSDTLKL